VQPLILVLSGLLRSSLRSRGVPSSGSAFVDTSLLARACGELEEED
jgi:hypothetical protein